MFPDTVVQTCIVHLIRNSITVVGRETADGRRHLILPEVLTVVSQADDDQGLVRTLGDRSDTGQASQDLIISLAQRVIGFCKQRGEDDSADVGKRTHDFHVTLRLFSRRPCEDGVGQPVEFAIRLRELLATTASCEKPTSRWATAASVVSGVTETAGSRSGVREPRLW